FGAHRVNRSGPGLPSKLQKQSLSLGRRRDRDPETTRCTTRRCAMRVWVTRNLLCVKCDNFKNFIQNQPIRSSSFQWQDGAQLYMHGVEIAKQLLANWNQSLIYPRASMQAI